MSSAGRPSRDIQGTSNGGRPSRDIQGTSTGGRPGTSRGPASRRTKFDVPETSNRGRPRDVPPSPLYIQIKKAAELAAELGNDTAMAQECDGCREEDIERLVGAAVERFGRLDIFCANAGYLGKMNCVEAVMENMATSEFDRQIQVNLRGVVLCIKHAACAMKKNTPGPVTAGLSRGCIIATASVAGQIVNGGCASGTPLLISAGYAASKAGVIQVCKLGACELAPYHIRVNAVCPGIVATPMVDEFLLGNTAMPEEEIAAILAKTSPLRGMAILPTDIAQAMLFLASNAARCVNGSALTVDCGMVAGVAGFVPGLAADGAELGEAA